MLYKNLDVKARVAQEQYNDKAMIQLFRLDKSLPQILNTLNQETGLSTDGSIKNLIDEYRMPALSSLLKTALLLKGKYKPKDFVGKITDPADGTAMTQNEKAVKYGRFINATGISVAMASMLDRSNKTAVEGNDPQNGAVQKMFPDAKVVFVQEGLAN